MKFKNWIENGSEGIGIPQMGAQDVNNQTPASDAVRQTGLQPQVDSRQNNSKYSKEQDRILAIDSEIEHMDMNIPDGMDSDTPKINKFKEMWDNLKQTWDQIKMSDNNMDSEEGGLGSNMGDPKYVQTMQQNPNMVPMSMGTGVPGPGTFGNS